MTELLRLSSFCASHLPLLVLTTVVAILVGAAALGHMRRSVVERALVAALALVLPVTGVVAVGARLTALRGQGAAEALAVSQTSGTSTAGTGASQLASGAGAIGRSAWSPQGAAVLVLAAAAAGACIGFLIVTARSRSQEIRAVRTRRIAPATPAQAVRGWGGRVALVAGASVVVAGMLGLFGHAALGTPTTWGAVLASF